MSTIEKTYTARQVSAMVRKAVNAEQVAHQRDLRQLGRSAGTLSRNLAIAEHELLIAQGVLDRIAEAIKEDGPDKRGRRATAQVEAVRALLSVKAVEPS